MCRSPCPLPRRCRTPILALVCLTATIVAGTAASGAEPGEDFFELSLEELRQVEVVTASKRSELRDEAPNVMHVITREEIRRRGYRNLGDLLVGIPGFGVFHRDLDFVSQVRGVAPNGHNKVTYMVNGHSINNVTETSVLNGPINLDQVERVEVIVGPGSVLYGSETLLATVNLITTGAAGSEIVVTGGSDTFSGTVNLASRFGPTATGHAAFTFLRRDGWDAWDADNRPGLAGSDITGKVHSSYFITAGADIDGFALNVVSYNLDQPEANLIMVAADQGLVVDAHRQDSVDAIVFERSFDVGSGVASTLRGTYDNKRMVREITAGYVAADNFDLAQKIYGAEWDLERKTDRAVVQAGLQYKHKQNRHNYLLHWAPDDPAPPDSVTSVFALVSNRNTSSLGGYLSIDYRAHARWRFVAAARADWDEILHDGKVHLSPRLAAIYRPGPGWISKLMYNRATRIPDPWMSPLNHVWDIDAPGAPAWLVNPPARRPETLSTIEWQNIVYVAHSRVALNLYYQELEDFIAWYRPFTNVGDYSGHGAELEFETTIGQTLNLWLNGSWVETEFMVTANETAVVTPTNDSGDMVAVPRYTANLGLEWEVTSGLFFTPLARWFTRQPAYLRPAEVWGYVDDQWYLDATLRWTSVPVSGLELHLSGHNLTDNRDHVSAQFRAERYRPRGASFALTVTYRF